jgi:HPt (histidine-containing phosphotransfer) domain-containing protein
MTNRLLVSISANGATLARWRGGQLAECEFHDLESDAIAAFEDAIAATPAAPVYLLVDSVDEDYRIELLPHTWGRERAQLVARRLRQIYRGSPYCAALARGRDAGGRRDDRWFFLALTNAELIAPWLDAAARMQAPLAGLYALPMVYARLPARLGLGAADLLLVGETEAGLRQTWFQRGELRLSRLTPHQPAYTVQGSTQYAEQIDGTRSYLESLRLIGREDTLSVVLLDQQGSFGALAERLAAPGANTVCRLVGAEELARAAGLRAPLQARSLDALALALLGAAAPQGDLAPAPARAAWRRRNAARAIHGAAGAAGLAALAVAGWMLHAAGAAHDSAAEARREAAVQQARYAAVTQGFPAAPASGAEMRLAVQAAQQVESMARSPQRVYATVARALEPDARLTLRSIDWRSGALAPGAAPGAPGTPPAQPGAAGASGAARGEEAIVTGGIDGYAGDFRGAHDAVERFVARLRSDASVQTATIVRLPLDVRPEAALAGTTREALAGSKPDEALFSVAIVMRAGAP